MPYYLRHIACCAFLCSFTAAAQTGSGFPSVGIASGQSARINLVNMASPNPSNPTSCGVVMQFLDSSGNVLKQSTTNLQPGAATSLDLSRDEVTVDGLRVQLRAVLLYGYAGGANPPGRILQQTACSDLMPSLEVYDNTTGRTSLLLTDVRRLPGPSLAVQ